MANGIVNKPARTPVSNIKTNGIAPAPAPKPTAPAPAPKPTAPIPAPKPTAPITSTTFGNPVKGGVPQTKLGMANRNKFIADQLVKGNFQWDDKKVADSIRKQMATSGRTATDKEVSNTVNNIRTLYTQGGGKVPAIAPTAPTANKQTPAGTTPVVKPGATSGVISGTSEQDLTPGQRGNLIPELTPSEKPNDAGLTSPTGATATSNATKVVANNPTTAPVKTNNPDINQYNTTEYNNAVANKDILNQATNADMTSLSSVSNALESTSKTLNDSTTKGYQDAQNFYNDAKELGDKAIEGFNKISEMSSNASIQKNAKDLAAKGLSGQSGTDLQEAFNAQARMGAKIEAQKAANDMYGKMQDIRKTYADMITSVRNNNELNAKYKAEAIDKLQTQYRSIIDPLATNLRTINDNLTNKVNGQQNKLIDQGLQNDNVTKLNNIKNKITQDNVNWAMKTTPEAKFTYFKDLAAQLPNDTQSGGNYQKFFLDEAVAYMANPANKGKSLIEMYNDITKLATVKNDAAKEKYLTAKTNAANGSTNANNNLDALNAALANQNSMKSSTPTTPTPAYGQFIKDLGPINYGGMTFETIPGSK